MKTLIKEKPFVDVILPNYNKAEFLEESINSVTTQTYNNWKLFVIDDSSQDDSKKIINNYKSRNIKAIYLYKDKGAAFCRNLGIRLSNSKYISFIDSDDYWSSDKLKKQIFFLISVQVDILVRPYTMDFIQPAKILTRLNSWSTLKKGVVGNLTRFVHENGVLLQQNFLVNWAHFGGN